MGLFCSMTRLFKCAHKPVACLVFLYQLLTSMSNVIGLQFSACFSSHRYTRLLVFYMGPEPFKQSVHYLSWPVAFPLHSRVSFLLQETSWEFNPG